MVSLLPLIESPMQMSTGSSLSCDEQPVNASMRLRRDTHTIHAALHLNPLTKDLLKPSILLKDYLFVLIAFHRFHQSIERTIEANWDGFLHQPKSDLIKNDLISLGVDENPLEPAKTMNLPYGEDALLGLRYVMGGSALGARHIRESVSRHLKLQPSTGISFFDQLSLQTDAEWKDFKADLDANVISYDRCLAAATETFKSMDRWLWKAYDAMGGREGMMKMQIPYDK